MSRLRLCATLAMLGACAGDTALSPCDIREPHCQYDVFLAVQDVRGSLWDPYIEPPPMEVISDEAYRALVIAQRERALQERGIDYLNEGLKLLRMIDPNEMPDDEIDDKVSSVAAFYDSLTHRVTIIDSGEPANQAEEVRTLAHELVHAAQDRDVSFGRLYQQVASTDNVNALSALLEGEADLYALLVDAKQRDIAKGAIRWSIVDDYLTQLRLLTSADFSPYRFASIHLPYPLGGVYFAKAYVEGGPLAVRRTYDPPPLTAARFMAGRGAPGDAPAPAWTCGRVSAPSGHELVIADELGALGLYAFATRVVLTEAEAWERAGLWTGDRFYVFRRPEDPSALAVVWLLRSVDASAAAALQAFINNTAWAQAGLQTFLRGDTLHVFASKLALEQPYDSWMRCEPP